MAAAGGDDVEMAEGGTGVEPNAHKRNSDDMGWEWGFNPNPDDKICVKCLLCGHESHGGINRLKHHLAHIGTAVSKCKKVTEEIKARCKENIEGTGKKKKDKVMNDKEIRSAVLDSVGYTEGAESQSRAGSSDASEAQGFLFEGGDAHALMVFHDPDEGFVPGTTVPWQMLGEAVGADEILQPRRSSRGTRELNEEEWESAPEDGDEDDIAYEDEDGDEDEIREVCGFV